MTTDRYTLTRSLLPSGWEIRDERTECLLLLPDEGTARAVLSFLAQAQAVTDAELEALQPPF